MTGVAKAEGALRTISEVSEQFAIPQHILRYWESRFPQLRPLQRAGNRRYYRPEDVALVARIHELLNRDGYTIKGVQKLLSSRRGAAQTAAAPAPVVELPQPPAETAPRRPSPELLTQLRMLRAELAALL